jgi:hypothetical protein
MNNDFYKQGIKNFIENMLRQVGNDIKLSDEQLKNLLTN